MALPPSTISANSPAEGPKKGVDLASAAEYAAAEKAASTRKAYRADWQNFSDWTASREVQLMPAEPRTICAYIAELADSGITSSTIARRLAAIAYAHKLQGIEPPTSSEMVRAVFRGIRRRIGTAVVKKAPAVAEILADMLAQVPTSLAGLRDRAILLIGFAAGLRRSELVDLKVNDVEITKEGAIVQIVRSKTDQEGEGAGVAIPRGEKLKPIDALEAWLAAGRISDGPIFRSIAKGGRISDRALSDRSVAELVKRYARAAGLDPRIFSGHSLRAGLVTSALDHGADLFKIMDITRHRSVDTLKGYDRRARAFRNHAGKDFL